MAPSPPPDPPRPSSRPQSVWVRLATWAFGKLVGLYPQDVRTEYGAAMQETFETGLLEREGPAGLRWALRELVTVLIRASLERWQGTWIRVSEIARLLSGSIRPGLSRVLRSPSRACGMSLMVFGAGALVTIAASLRAGIAESVSLIEASGPQQLMFGTDHVRGWRRTHLGASEIIRLGREAPSVRRVGAFTAPSTVRWVDTSGRPRSITAIYGTPSTLSLLGMELIAGSLAQSVDEPSVFVTHGFWQSQLGGLPVVPGDPLQLGRDTYRIAGVLEPGARSPDFSGFDVWIALTAATAAPGPDAGRGLRIPQYLGVVELRRGASAAAAQRELSGLASGAPDRGVRLVSRAEYATEDAKFGVRVIVLCAAGLLLLALLEVSWTAGLGRRKDEVRVRMVLGAPPVALWAEDVMSVGVLSSLVAAMGSATAYVLVPHLPTALGWPDRLGASPSAFVPIAVAAAFLVVHAAGAAARYAGSAGGSHDPPGGHPSGGLLVGAHAVAALILLVVAGGLGTRLLGMKANAAGLGKPGILMIRTDLSALPRAAAHQLRKEGAARASADAQADFVGLWAPDTPDQSYWFDDISATSRPGDIRSVPRIMVGGQALEALGIEVLEGRGISRNDHADAKCVALVSSALAADLWPSASPIGLTIDVNHGAARCTVVGRVSDMRHTAAPTTDQTLQNVYFALSQWPSARVSWVYSNPRTTPESIEEWIRGLDGAIAVQSRAWLDVRQANRMRPLRRAASVSGLLALLATALGLIGSHHAMRSFASAQRRSIALRAAVGASPMRLGFRILRVGMVPQLAGLGFGATACLVFRESLSSWLGLAHLGWYGLGSAALLLGLGTVASIPVTRVAAGGDLARALHPD